MMAHISTVGQLFCAISTGWDAVRQWIINTEQSLVDIITAIGGIIPAIDMCALAGVALCLLVWLKSATVKLKAVTLKLLSAVQGFALLHLRQCCLNIGSQAEFYLSILGLEITLRIESGFIAICLLLWVLWPKTRIRRHPKRMRHRARRRRRR